MFSPSLALSSRRPLGLFLHSRLPKSFTPISPPLPTSPNTHRPPTPEMDFRLHWISKASVLAVLIILLTFFLLLPQTYQLLKRLFLRLFFPASVPPSIIIIDEFNDKERFRTLRSYLRSKCFPSAQSPELKNSNTLTFAIDSDVEIQDDFDGMHVKWSPRTTEKESKIFGYVYRRRKIRSFELSFHNKHTTKVRAVYMPHVMQEAARINRENVNWRAWNLTRAWLPFIGSLAIQFMGSC